MILLAEHDAAPAVQAMDRSDTLVLAALRMAAALQEALHDEADGPEYGFGPAMAAATAVLWSGFLEFDAADPHWPDRDRIVLSDPDGVKLLAAIYRLTGQGLDPSEIAPGRPGGGLAAAVGLALAERVLAATFGKSLVDHRTWVLASAAEMHAGPAMEAACLAGHLRLERLTVLLHAPREGDDLLRRFAALGWATKRVPADDPAQLAGALSLARRSRKPSLIACAAAGWRDDTGGADADPLWQAAGTRGATARRAWLKRLARHPQRAEFERVTAGRLPDACLEDLARLRVELAETGLEPIGAGRRAIAATAPLLPELLGGTSLDAASLFGTSASTIAPGQFAGRTLNYGGRTGAMMAAMAGMAAHGGIIPCAAVPLAASDSLCPALRQAATMGLRTVLLVRGACGEHLAALRAMPNLLVLRPADALEVAECWEIALRRTDGPSVIVLEPGVPAPPRPPLAENRSARGGYVLTEANGPRQATLIGTGCEVAVASAARDALQDEGIPTAVVSLPCWELFGRAGTGWIAAVLGSAPRFALEAGCRFGWDRWLGEGGTFIGPAQGPQGLGITVEAVVTAVRKRLTQGNDTTWP